MGTYIRWQTAIGVPAGFEDQLHRFVQHYAAPTAVPDDAEVLALFGLSTQLHARLHLLANCRWSASTSRVDSAWIVQKFEKAKHNVKA